MLRVPTIGFPDAITFVLNKTLWIQSQHSETMESERVAYEARLIKVHIRNKHQWLYLLTGTYSIAWLKFKNGLNLVHYVAWMQKASSIFCVLGQERRQLPPTKIRS
jgi:hypothetical protein